MIDLIATLLAGTIATTPVASGDEALREGNGIVTTQRRNPFYDIDDILGERWLTTTRREGRTIATGPGPLVDEGDVGGLGLIVVRRLNPMHDPDDILSSRWQESIVRAGGAIIEPQLEPDDSLLERSPFFRRNHD